MTKGLTLGSLPVLAMAFALCGYITLAVHEVHQSFALFPATSGVAGSTSDDGAARGLPDDPAAGIRFRTLSDGSIDHSTALVLLDPQGRVLARTGDAGDTTAFVAAVRRALQRQ